MSADITLLPHMTAAQIAHWCAEHKMFVQIDYTTGPDGCFIPLISARPELNPAHVPMFLRRQAD